MTNTPSFQDLLNDFADEVFVGRSEQLSLFEGAIKATKPSFLILNISGQGGVGKSTLLERYRGISKSNKVAYAIVNEDHLTIPKILETFVQQLEDDGLDFDHFNERYRKYQELKEKVEADPNVPTGLMDFALRGIAKVGIKSLKRIPIAGDVADVFLSPESEEVIAEQTSEFTKYIIQKFTNKDERVLLLETDSELAKYFLEDLTKALKNRKAVLSFDTYEKTSESIEKWLIDLLMGAFGQFSSNVLFVIAGRYALGQNQNWTRFRKAMRQVELKEFTEEEAKDYLIRSGITDEKLISQFIEVSERLPVLLALLVSSPSQLPHDVSGDAVQRFLQGLTSEQREAALIASLPRYFNIDILASILGDEAGKRAFEWLSRAHFVKTSENGWVYHDVVRLMMLRYFRKRSNQQFIDTHKLLEEFYKKQIVNFEVDANNQNTSAFAGKFETERAYHFICQNFVKNIEVLVKNSAALYVNLTSNNFESLSHKKETEESFKILASSYSRSLLSLCDDHSDLITNEQLHHFRNLAKLFSDELIDDIPNLFDWLIKIDVLNEQEKNGMCIWRGRTYYQMEEYSSALTDFTKAIELQPENGNNYNWRGSTYYQMKEYSSALTDFTKAIELQPENEYNYYWRGVIYSAMGDYPAALESAVRAEVLARRTDDKNVLASTLSTQGIARFRLGDAQAALALNEQALAIFTELKSKKEIARCLNLIAAVHYVSGTLDQAQESWEKALKIFQELGDRVQGMDLLSNLGVIAETRGDYEAAFQRYDDAVKIAHETGYKDGEIVFLSNRGSALVALKRYEEAEDDLRQAIGLAGIDGSWAMPLAFNSRSEALLGLERIDEAFYSARQALVLAEEDKSPEYIGMAWRTLAMIADRRGIPVYFSDGETHLPGEYNAETCFRKSVQILTDAEINLERARTLREWARYELKIGAKDEGIKLWQDARDIFAKLGGQMEVDGMANLPE